MDAFIQAYIYNRPFEGWGDEIEFDTPGLDYSHPIHVFLIQSGRNIILCFCLSETLALFHFLFACTVAMSTGFKIINDMFSQL